MFGPACWDPEERIFADEGEQKFVNKKATTLLENPEKYAKEKLKSKHFKQAKKALRNIEDINIKLPRNKNLYPAISIANWSGAILHINMGTAPFKYSDPMFKDGIYNILTKDYSKPIFNPSENMSTIQQQWHNYLGLGIFFDLLRPVEYVEESIRKWVTEREEEKKKNDQKEENANNNP